MESFVFEEPKDVPQVIDMLGGVSVVARWLELPWPSNVSEMKRSGRISTKHWSKLIALAEQKNLPLTERTLVRLHKREATQ